MSIYGRFRIQNAALRLFVGETIGIFIATLLIDASVFNFAVSDNGSNLGMSFGIGMAVAFGIYTCAMVSPMGPNNPTVALGFVLSGVVAGKHLLLYWGAELLGAFAAHLCSYGIYYEALHDLGSRLYNGSAFQVPQTVFLCTMPKPYASTTTQAFEILISVSLTVFLNLAIIDDCNCTIPVSAQPCLVGLVIALLKVTLSHNTGGPLNTAMDLTGRVVSSIVGWGSGVWTYGFYYSWIPIVVNLLGGVLGAIAYNSLIGPNLPRPRTVAKDSQASESNEEDSPCYPQLSDESAVHLKYIQ